MPHWKFFTIKNLTRSLYYIYVYTYLLIINLRSIFRRFKHLKKREVHFFFIPALVSDSFSEIICLENKLTNVFYIVWRTGTVWSVYIKNGILNSVYYRTIQVSVKSQSIGIARKKTSSLFHGCCRGCDGGVRKF